MEEVQDLITKVKKLEKRLGKLEKWFDLEELTPQARKARKKYEEERFKKARIDANVTLRTICNEIVSTNALLDDILDLWDDLDEGLKLRFSTDVYRMYQIIFDRMKSTDLKMIKSNLGEIK